MKIIFDNIIKEPLYVWMIIMGVSYLIKKIFIKDDKNNIDSKIHFEENGIRIRYNNKDLKINCLEYCVNGTIDKEKFNDGLTREDWINFNKEFSLGFMDFYEEDVLVPWESIKNWEIDSRYSQHLTIYIENLKFPIKITLNPFIFNKEVSYLKKKIPQKRLGIKPLSYMLLLIISGLLLVLISTVLEKMIK